MVEVNGASKYGRYERILFRSLNVMSSIEVLAIQGEQKNSYPGGPPKTTDDNDPYVTHMNQKTLLKASYIGTFNSVQVCSSVVSVFES